MVAARLQEQHGMFRLSGCPAVRLFGCSVARPLGGIGGAAAGRIDVSGDAGCIPAVLSGIGFRLAFRTSFPDLFRDWLPGLLRDLLRDWLSDLLFGPASGSASRSAFGLVSGPAFRTCFRVCFPDAGAILFDCGMRSVVPIRPQDSSAQFLPQQLPAAGV
jgi:hypothetical protein